MIVTKIQALHFLIIIDEGITCDVNMKPYAAPTTTYTFAFNKSDT